MLWKLCFCTFINSSCANLKAYNSYPTSCRTYFFYSCTIVFLACNSWVTICLILVFVFLLIQVAICAFCLVFSHFVAFALSVLRIWFFANWFLSIFPSQLRYISWCNIFSCSIAIVVHMSFLISLYFFIQQLFYINTLFIITCKLFKNSIASKIKIYYIINLSLLT